VATGINWDQLGSTNSVVPGNAFPAGSSPKTLADLTPPRVSGGSKSLTHRAVLTAYISASWGLDLQAVVSFGMAGAASVLRGGCLTLSGVTRWKCTNHSVSASALQRTIITSHLSTLPSRPIKQISESDTLYAGMRLGLPSTMRHMVVLSVLLLLLVASGLPTAAGARVNIRAASRDSTASSVLAGHGDRSRVASMSAAELALASSEQLRVHSTAGVGTAGDYVPSVLIPAFPQGEHCVI